MDDFTHIVAAREMLSSFLHDMNWAVAMRSDYLTPVFKGFTLLGYSGFLILFVAVGYWAINGKVFARLGVFLLLSVLFNAYLKDWFQDPRPDAVFHLDARVGRSYGFPSGHAQVAVVLWFWLALAFRKHWVWIVSSVLVAGICFSRLYLGVHDVEDVLGGMGVGFVSLRAFAFLTSDRFGWWETVSPVRRMAAILAINACFFLAWPGKLNTHALGYGIFLVGLWAGVCLNTHCIGFTISPDWRKRVLAGLIGLVVFIALRKALPLLGDVLHVNGAFYRLLTQGFLLSLFITAGAPWLFLKLRLGGGRADLSMPVRR